MNWRKFHGRSEKYAALAEGILLQGLQDVEVDLAWFARTDSDLAVEMRERLAALGDLEAEAVARELYGQAAEDEVRALGALDPSKQRTLGITAVSAAALLWKAGRFNQCSEFVANCKRENLPEFALEELQEIEQAALSSARQVFELSIAPKGAQQWQRREMEMHGRSVTVMDWERQEQVLAEETQQAPSVGRVNNQGNQSNVSGSVEGERVPPTVIQNITVVSAEGERDQRNRGVLLEFVRDEVAERLRSSLHGRLEALLSPETTVEPEMVLSRWASDVRLGSNGNGAAAALETSVTEIFRSERVRGKLLILGAPGAGKTTMLLELARDLLAEVSEERGRIPVLLNLSAWRQAPEKPMEDWLTAQLKDKYGVRADIGARWWQEGQLLPLLDGLDELATERQEACVAAINGLRLPQVVVCSRLEEYGRLEGHLALNGAICVRPLTDGQIQGYLARFGKEELWAALVADAEALELARTPLFLSVVVLSGVAVQQWRDGGKKQLFGEYTREMLAKREGKGDYGEKPPSEEQVKDWLGWLAAQMKERDRTEFFIEELQPSWLNESKPWQTWKYQLIGQLIIGLTLGLIGGLVFGPIIGLTIDLTGGLLLGLIGGLIVGLTMGLIGLIIRLVTKPKNIKPAETMAFSVVSLIAGLVAGLIFGLILGLIAGLVAGLIFGLVFGLTGGLIFSLVGTEVQVKREPNQGIFRAWKNTQKLMLWMLPITVALAVGAKVTLSGYYSEVAKSIGAAVGSCAPLPLWLAFIFFGQACAQHFSLRLVLFHHGYAPWNYAKFLNYATELGFLQRVGGGYRFVHKLLQEHFAEEYGTV